MANRHTNIFSVILSKINLRNRKVLIGTAVVLALVIVSLIVGENSVTNRFFNDDNLSDTVSMALEIEDLPAEEAARTIELTDDAQPQTEATAEAAVEASTEASTEVAAPSETRTEPELKSDSEIKREIDEETRVDDSNTLYSMAAVEVMPQFPGGEAALYKYIADNLRYPANAQEDGVSGRVIVQFTVNKSGNISDVSVIRSRHPSLDREAVRVVRSMPRWNPGKQNGHPVNVIYTLPVTFRLQ